MDFLELKAKYTVKTVSDEWFLLKSDEVLELIEEGLDSGLQLDVVEGFLESPEGAFEPRQEYSSDQYIGLNEDEYKRKTIELIKSSSEIPKLYFEVFMS